MRALARDERNDVARLDAGQGLVVGACEDGEGHARRVERDADAVHAVLVRQHDQPAQSGRGAAQVLDGGLGRSLRAHAGARVVDGRACEEHANQVLAVACRRRTGHTALDIRARAPQRRVADTSGPLERRAARRQPHGHAPGHVHADNADGAHAVGLGLGGRSGCAGGHGHGRRCDGGGDWSGWRRAGARLAKGGLCVVARQAFNLVEALQLAPDQQRLGRAHLEAVLLGQAAAPVRDDNDVARLVHDDPRELHRVAHVAHGAARCDLEVVRGEDRVHLDVAGAVDKRSAARVKRRIVLEHLHGGLHRVDRRRASREHPAGEARSRHHAALVVVHGLVRDVPRAAVNHYAPRVLHPLWGRTE
eukprot:Unigene13983_Nuclearia_a/m.42252 Unigene13983_Nuclearia_a/g.42252  ORF Unigene13983_Nuclearia_a/g.42252 Unigene13983_Nuclearia_a/m.42252 type:complete len:362 (-) Unigene13983_Nuclearia_a:4-1089(-)